MKFRIIVISAPAHYKNEVGYIVRLFESGLDTLHLRKPDLSREELHELIKGIPAKYHRRIVIHSHYTLLKEFKLKGIHLTERTRIKPMPSGYAPGKHTLSASFHSTKDIKASRRPYNYVFLSPIFDSISKRNYKAHFSERELREALEKHRNIIALGGTEPLTIKKIRSLKFAGAATLGFIWESKNPVKAFRQLISKIK